MFRKIIYLLTFHERKNAGFLLLMILIMALLDVLGVASILPFIAVMTNPDIISTNGILKELVSILGHAGIQEKDQILVFLGLTFFLLLVISLAIKAYTINLQTRFCLMCEYSIGKRLIEGYLWQPYDWFLGRHSADLGKSILSEVGTVIGGGVTPFVTLVAQSVVSTALAVLLVLVDPALAISSFAVVGCFYYLIFYSLRGWLKKIGEERLTANTLRFLTVSNAFGGIKEVKFGGVEDLYVAQFAKSAKVYAEGQAAAQLSAYLPKFILEGIGFGGILLLLVFLVGKDGSLDAALPTIALYVFAGYRLIPSLQQVYGAAVKIRFIGPALEALEKELQYLPVIGNENEPRRAINFNEGIRLTNVSYTYSGSATSALKDVDFIIPARSSIGLAGTTGSGKTTLVDIILGLLYPNDGDLTVDNIKITNANRKAWRRHIGYTPQNINLIDETILSNIAFGIAPEDICHHDVECAAKIAQIHDFICSLPHGYATKIGERGVRLSGGQRQRLGIARALYKKPSLLILDEATSALDNITEKAVINGIHAMRNDLTIIHVAHRLSSLKNCDEIILLEHGSVKAIGSFAELLETDGTFRVMAQSGGDNI